MYLLIITFAVKSNQNHPARLHALGCVL